jgi:flagellar L-ring protein precursor FlgH
MVRRAIPLLAVVLSGCSSSNFDVGVPPPQLSAVGSGLSGELTTAELADNPAFSKSDAGWTGGAADYFRDQRARREGDLITVRIAINDKAAFNNTSALSRQAQGQAGLDASGNFVGFGLPSSGLSGKTNASSSSQGQGSTVRSEKIDLSVAAIVTGVLPNGYLVIDGSQEVMVNDEQRVLRVAGIVHPRDISPENVISYEKIAEARISYGGSGRIADEQRPTMAQKLWSRLNLF